MFNWEAMASTAPASISSQFRCLFFLESLMRRLISAAISRSALRSIKTSSLLRTSNAALRLNARISISAGAMRQCLSRNSTRLTSVVVLPLPARATTCMCPWTAEMAAICSSSGSCFGVPLLFVFVFVFVFVFIQFATNEHFSA